MDRAGGAGRVASDLVVDGVEIALGQELTDAPHVPLQRQELVSDVGSDLPEFVRRRQPFGRRLNTPELVEPGMERIPERAAVGEAAGHGDGLGVEVE